MLARQVTCSLYTVGGSLEVTSRWVSEIFISLIGQGYFPLLQWTHFDSFSFGYVLFLVRPVDDFQQQANFRGLIMKGSFRVSHYRGWAVGGVAVVTGYIRVKVWAAYDRSPYSCWGPGGVAKRQASSFLSLLNLLYYPATLLSSPSDLLLYPTFLLLPRTSQPSCSLAWLIMNEADHLSIPSPFYVSSSPRYQTCQRLLKQISDLAVMVAAESLLNKE